MTEPQRILNTIYNGKSWPGVCERQAKWWDSHFERGSRGTAEMEAWRKNLKEYAKYMPI
jgi:hypothetical protein